MIDFKSEILKVQQENYIKARNYNEVIEENYQRIENLFSSEEFKVYTKKELDGSLTLVINKEKQEGRMIINKFNCLYELEKLKRVQKDIDVKSFIEGKLKQFVVETAIKYDLKIEE